MDSAALLSYGFVQRAFVVGLLLAVIIPCIGVVIVLKRLSMIGDAFSHSALAGVALGLVLGINPTLGAFLACMAAALSIEALRKKIPQYAEMAIAIVMAACVGFAGVFSGMVRGSANFSSFLFGSLMLVSDMEMYVVIGGSVVVMALLVVLYKELFFIAFDERGARLAGVPVRFVNVVFTLLTAVTVSIASRTIGALVVSSLMVVPVACAMQLAKSYRQTQWYAAGLGVVFTVIGLLAAFVWNLRPGSAIVLTGVAALVLILAGKGGARRWKRARKQ